MDLNTIKNWFKRGMFPTESQFAQVFDFFWNKNDKLPVTDVDGLADVLTLKADVEYVNIKTDATNAELTAHIGDVNNPHQVTKAQLQLDNVTNHAQVKRSELGMAMGVATLNEIGQIPESQIPSRVIVDTFVSNYNSLSSFIANELGTTGFEMQKGDTVLINDVVDGDGNIFNEYWQLSFGDGTHLTDYISVDASKIDWSNIKNKPSTIYYKNVDDASSIKLITDNFGKNFSASTDTLQKLADLLDDKLFGHNIQQRGVDMPEAESLNFMFNISYNSVTKAIDISYNPLVQYSVDGSTNWHDTYVSGTDAYRRESFDNGTTWGTVIYFAAKELSRRVEIAVIGQLTLESVIGRIEAEKITQIYALDGIYTLKLVNELTPFNEIAIKLNGVNQTLPISIPVSQYYFSIVYESGKTGGLILLKTEKA